MGEGANLRPATPADYARIVEIARAEDRHYRGFSDFTRDELEIQIIGESSFDPERDLVVAEVDGVITGAGVIGPLVTFILVDPMFGSETLRVSLLEWTEHRQRELQREAYRISTYAKMIPTVEVLRAGGYSIERLYSNMARTFAGSGPLEAALLPSGYRIRRGGPRRRSGPPPTWVGAGDAAELLRRHSCGGLPTAELHVASDNPKALDLYSGVGMAENERIESYIRTP